MTPADRPAPPDLDVERLARALDAVNLVIIRGTAEEWAEKVAAEYSRLSEEEPDDR